MITENKNYFSVIKIKSPFSRKKIVEIRGFE
jgi:hypothetical protein